MKTRSAFQPHRAGKRADRAQQKESNIQSTTYAKDRSWEIEVLPDKRSLTKGNESMSWQLSGAGQRGVCLPFADNGAGRCGVKNIKAQKISWNRGLIETSQPNLLVTSQYTNNKTQSPCDGHVRCALAHPSTVTTNLPAHSAPLPPANLCSLDTRNTLVNKGPCTWSSLCLESSCSRLYDVTYTHFFQLLAVKSILQKGLF